MNNLYNKHFWNKLNKEFNAYVEKDSYQSARVIQIEHIGFFPNHIGHRGLNHNESSLLDFGTRIIEANAVHFAYNSKFKSVDLYIRSTVHSYDAGTYIEFVRDGETVSVEMYDREERVPWQIRQILNGDVETDLFQYYSQDEFKRALVNAGCKILVFFRFNAKINVSIPHMLPGIGKPKYIKVTKRGVELRWNGVGTYNSLPNIVRVTRMSAIPAVKLSDLGIEDKGYYSHDLRCSIPKGQVKAAKRFFSNYRKGL